MNRAVRAVGVVAVAVLVAACGSTANRPDERAITVERGGDTGALDPATIDPATGTSVEGSTDGSDGSTGSTSATGGAGAGSSAAPGTPAGPAVTDLIELGFVTTATSNAGAFGFTPDDRVSERDIIDALVAAYNDAGGIAGRPIEPVFAETDTGSSSWEADFAAACSTFTEDNHVAAVLGYVFNHSEAFESCLASKGIAHVSTTTNVPDAEGLLRYPLLIAAATPTIERRSLTKIDGAIAAGVLSRTSRLGVVTDACPSTKRAWSSIIRPHIERKGITLASVFELGCATGAGDAAGEAGRVASLLLQFRNAGVDRLTFMSVSEGPALFVLANAAEGQGWRPTYIVSSLAQTALVVDQIPESQAANVHGLGWQPVMDVKPGQWPATTAAAGRCLSMLESQGIVPLATTAFAYAFSACEAMFLYEAALAATRGASDGTAVVAAIEAMGTTFNSVANLEGRTRFGPGHHDGPALARHFAWDPGCSCFAYRQLSLPIS